LGGKGEKKKEKKKKVRLTSSCIPRPFQFRFLKKNFVPATPGKRGKKVGGGGKKKNDNLR